MDSVSVPNPRPWKTGDLVRFVGGGPKMAVEMEVTPPMNGEVTCTWYRRGRFRSRDFHARLLVPWKAPQARPQVIEIPAAREMVFE